MMNNDDDAKTCPEIPFSIHWKLSLKLNAKYYFDKGIF